MSTVRFERLEGALAERLDSLFGVPGCLIEVNPGKVLLPPKYRELGQRIKDFKVRPDDVWVISYPRTGSTWVQEMVWCIGNDLDFEAAKTFGHFRNPLLELTALIGNDTGSWKDGFGNSVELAENMKSPRFIKTHLPVTLLPKEIFTVRPKIIYVSRNPKDMCVSYYHYCRLLHDFRGSFEEFAELFLQGKAPVGPYWSHVLGFWDLRHDDNVLFLKYEEIRKDHRGGILRTSKFLGKDLSEDDVSQLMDHLSFQRMRQNPALNLEPFLQARNGPEFKQEGDQTFIRKGKVGDWKNYMSPELADRFDSWTKENLQGTGLSFSNEE